MKKFTGRPETIITAMVLLVGFIFAACTRHVWEDYLIAFRVSKNLATGHGLVFTPGERLHTFTSPLGVLLPAAFYFLTGNQSDLIALWLFRAASLAALAAGLILLFQTLRSLQLRLLSCWLTVAMIGLDAKILDFTINGMETGLLVLFLALTIHGLLVKGPRQVLRLGIGWAGLMWSRPDSCVYIAVLALASLMCLPRRAFVKSLPAWFRTLLWSGLVCTVLYLPWFLWAWSYYGSPVPHTVLAKGTNQPPISLVDLPSDLITFPIDLVVGTLTSVQYMFLPAYADRGGWAQIFVAAAYALGLLAALAWALPGLRPQTRLFSLAFLLGNYFLTDVLKYYPPWYMPTVEVFGYLALGLFFDQLLALPPNPKGSVLLRNGLLLLPGLLHVSAFVLVAGQLAVLVCAGRQMQVQQALIEDGLRRPIGLWLREHARTPQDSVMLEPLGYIGYYSGLKMLDYPGLASKEMVEIRKRLGPERENQVYRELKPDWLVLRPWEAQTGFRVDVDGLQNEYEVARIFDATDKINALHWLPGRPYLQFDQTFIIFHRKPAPAL